MFAFLTLFNSQSFAEQSYSFYRCQNNDVLNERECAATCEKDGNAEVRFLVSKEKQVVVVQNRKRNSEERFQSVVTYGNCTVFNTNNWLCKVPTASKFSESVAQLDDGFYRFIFTATFEGKKRSDYWCGIPEK